MVANYCVFCEFIYVSRGEFGLLALPLYEGEKCGVLYTFLMSTSMFLSDSFIFLNRSSCHSSSSLYLHYSSSGVVRLGGGRKRVRGSIPNAKKSHSKNRSWWQKFFFDDDGNWLGLKDEDMNMMEVEESSDEDLSEGEKFEAWRRRAEAIIELREAQEDMRNQENRRWEDWVVTDDLNTSSGSGVEGWRDDHDHDPLLLWEEEEPQPGKGKGKGKGKGLVKSIRDLVLGKDDNYDILYEDRIFRYASFNSAKFLVVLIIVPWALDFLVHDYILMPFLDRYVKTVPLAAQILDVRRHQKLEMVKELKLEKARFRLEVEIGKSPPLSDEELWLELRHKALELRDEWRLENRRAFANIWSDMVFGISLFILIYFNQSKVAVLKFTGYKIINNFSDTGKAFLIILVTDIFLGYHSESGWQTLLEIIIEHYGFDIDQSAITIFVCLIPVIIDACVKLWMFKFLPRISPKVANIFREMKRH